MSTIDIFKSNLTGGGAKANQFASYLLPPMLSFNIPSSLCSCVKPQNPAWTNCN